MIKVGWWTASIDYFRNTLRVKSHRLFQAMRFCLPKATFRFILHGFACQKPQSTSEKMPEATFCFNTLHVCTGKFFVRETKCGFWQKRVKQNVAFGTWYETWCGFYHYVTTVARSKRREGFMILFGRDDEREPFSTADDELGNLSLEQDDERSLFPCCQNFDRWFMFRPLLS